MYHRESSRRRGWQIERERDDGTLRRKLEYCSSPHPKRGLAGEADSTRVGVTSESYVRMYVRSSEW